MKGHWVFLIRLGLLVIMASLLLGVFLLYTYSYEDFTAGLFTSIGQSAKLEKFRTLLLTRERFYSLRLIVSISTGIVIGIMLFLWKSAKQVAHILYIITSYIQTRFNKFMAFWGSLPVVSKYSTLALFILITVSRVYFLFRFPFHVDERFTYLYFVHKGVAVSAAYYPGPNNHILFTLFCTLFDGILNTPLLVMKIPALLVGLILSIVFWLIACHYVAYPLALAITGLFSFAEPVFYYSVHGRGYTLLMIFVIIASHNALKIANQKVYSFAAYFWFWLSCTLGFYTIPIFIYPFSSLVLFLGLHTLLQRRYAMLKHLILSSIAIASSVLLLYLPVILFNGWSALTGNAWVAPVSSQEYIATFLQHQVELATGVWGTFPGGKWLSLLLVIGCMGMVLQKQITSVHKQWMMVYLLNVAVLVGLPFLQQVLLPLRVIFYLSVYHYVMVGIMCTAFFQAFILQLYKLRPKFTEIYRGLYTKAAHISRMGNLLMAVAVFAIASRTIFTFTILTQPSQYRLYTSFDTTALWLYQHNANNIYVNDYDYGLCIRFQYETNGRDVLMDTNQPVPGKEYTYLVLHSSIPPAELFALAHYNKVFEDREVVIYKIEQY